MPLRLHRSTVGTLKLACARTHTHFKALSRELLHHHGATATTNDSRTGWYLAQARTAGRGPSTASIANGWSHCHTARHRAAPQPRDSDTSQLPQNLCQHLARDPADAFRAETQRGHRRSVKLVATQDLCGGVSAAAATPHRREPHTRRGAQRQWKPAGLPAKVTQIPSPGSVSQEIPACGHCGRRRRPEAVADAATVRQPEGGSDSQGTQRRCAHRR